MVLRLKKEPCFMRAQLSLFRRPLDIDCTSFAVTRQVINRPLWGQKQSQQTFIMYPYTCLIALLFPRCLPKKKRGGGAICFKLVLARKEPFDSVFKSVRQDKERSSLWLWWSWESITSQQMFPNHPKKIFLVLSFLSSISFPISAKNKNNQEWLWNVV